MKRLKEALKVWWNTIIVIFVRHHAETEKPKARRTKQPKRPKHWKNLDEFLTSVNKTRETMSLDFRSLEKESNLVSFFLAHRLGPYLVPETMKNFYAEHACHVEEIPVFGFVMPHFATTGKITEETLPGRFSAFMRVEAPPVNWEPQRDDEICVLINQSAEFDDERKKRKNFLYWYAAYVGIDKSTGYIRPLKHRVDSKIPIPGKRGVYIPTRQWIYPDWADRGSSAEERIQVITACAISTWASAEMLWQVKITDGKVPIIACIEINEAINLFSDRDRKEITKDGRRKAICHFVRAHERTTKNKTTVVKLHTRGAREFHWHGLDVSIRLPGKHGKSAGVWTLPAAAHAGMPKLIRRIFYGSHPNDGRFVEDRPNEKWVDDEQIADMIESVRDDA